MSACLNPLGPARDPKTLRRRHREWRRRSVRGRYVRDEEDLAIGIARTEAFATVKFVTRRRAVASLSLTA
jgi:hypothetical protein